MRYKKQISEISAEKSTLKSEYEEVMQVLNKQVKQLKTELQIAERNQAS